jgi:hypothetical protein
MTTSHRPATGPGQYLYSTFNELLDRNKDFFGKYNPEKTNNDPFINTIIDGINLPNNFTLERQADGFNIKFPSILPYQTEFDCCGNGKKEYEAIGITIIFDRASFHEAIYLYNSVKLYYIDSNEKKSIFEINTNTLNVYNSLLNLYILTSRGVIFGIEQILKKITKLRRVNILVYSTAAKITRGCGILVPTSRSLVPNSRSLVSTSRALVPNSRALVFGTKGRPDIIYHIMSFT